MDRDEYETFIKSRIVVKSVNRKPGDNSKQRTIQKYIRSFKKTMNQLWFVWSCLVLLKPTQVNIDAFSGRKTAHSIKFLNNASLIRKHFRNHGNNLSVRY